MQTKNMWNITMLSRDKHKYLLCAKGLTEEEAIKNAIKKVEANLWGNFGYKVVEIKYLGDKDGK